MICPSFIHDYEQCILTLLNLFGPTTVGNGFVHQCSCVSFLQFLQLRIALLSYSVAFPWQKEMSVWGDGKKKHSSD